MKLKVFCHFDSNSFQNAQNLLFQRLQALSANLLFQRLQALKKQILSVLKAIRIKVTKDLLFQRLLASACKR